MEPGRNSVQFPSTLDPGTYVLPLPPLDGTPCWAGLDARLEALGSQQLKLQTGMKILSSLTGQAGHARFPGGGQAGHVPFNGQ